MDKLKPCPFCGKEAIKSIVEPGLCFCRDCTANIPFDIWNTRAPDPRVEELEEKAIQFYSAVACVCKRCRHAEMAGDFNVATGGGDYDGQCPKCGAPDSDLISADEDGFYEFLNTSDPRVEKLVAALKETTNALFRGRPARLRAAIEGKSIIAEYEKEGK